MATPFNQGAPTIPVVLNTSNCFVFGNTASGNALSVQQLGTGNVATFRTTTGATALFVNAAGNVGVGQTNPVFTLDTTGTARVTSNLVVGGQSTPTTPFWIQKNAASGISGTAQSAWRGQALLTDANGTQFLSIGSDQTNAVSFLQAYGAGVNKPLSLQPNGGNVGIGTTSPGYTLDVSGIIRATSNIYLGAGGTGGTGTTIDSFSTYQRIQSWNSLPLAINPLGNNVGIGTASPQTTLDVNGSMNALNYAQSTFTNQGLVTITQTSASGTSMLTGATGTTWTAYAYSNQGFKYGAFCSARADQTNTLHMIGLASSQVNGNMGSTFQGISYAWYFDLGTLRIYESGSLVANYGAYTTSTVVSITFDGTNIIYWKDGVSQRTVARAVGVPLYFGYAGLAPGSSVNSIQFDAFGSTTYAGRNIVGTTGSFSGNVGIGTSSPSTKLSVEGVATTTGRPDTGATLNVNVNDAALSTTAPNGAPFGINVLQTASGGYRFCQFNSGYSPNGGGTLDAEFIVYGNGNVTADGTYTSPADYAEMFEWEDGNPDGEDRVGYSVMLSSGNKIRKSESTDSPDLLIGVVSGRPAVCADTAWNRWTDKYLKDDFNRYLTENYEVWKWTDADGKEISYYFDKIPEGVIVPENKTVIVQERYVLNPNYDPSAVYTPRMERKEWSPVGMVGKLSLRSGQLTGSRWIKLVDFSPSVSQWLIR